MKKGIALLITLLPALLLGGRLSESAEPSPPSSDCEERVAAVLGFPPAYLPRLSARTPIDVRLADRALRQIRKLRSECGEDVWRTERAFVNFALLRLRHLLGQGDTRRFTEEFANLLAPGFEHNVRSRLERDFISLRLPFARAVLDELRRDLLQTRWAEMADLDVSLESWSQEWEAGLGRAAPAAVDLAARRIALNFQIFDPLHLKIFLFHELAHIWDRENRPDADVYSNEVRAWAETLSYLGGLERNGVEIPSVFRAIRVNTRAWGLKNWVARVMDSRRSRGK